MDAGDLQGGFRLGDWLVEPLQQRIAGRAGTFVLPEPQVQLLLCLAEHHGEEVNRRTLAECGWPGDPQADGRLAAAIAELQLTLGDAPAHPHHLVPVGDDGYAMIAHVGPLLRSPAPGSDALPAGLIPPPPLTIFSRLHALVVELQRRQVFKVAASYLVGMWIVLQVAEVTFAPLHFPGWWITALTILAILGLPIVVSLAWTYEITPTGIVVDGGDTATGMKWPRARRAVAPVIVGGVIAMAGVTGFAWWRSIQTDVPPVAAAIDPGVPSVAVLPLVDMSPGGGNGYLGDGLSEELSMRLAQVPGLRVASRTSAFEFKDKSLDVRHIGQQLGVRHVLEGSVRRDGDHLRVIVQLIDARTGYHVWAGNFDRSWRDVLAMQDEVARSVTDALQVVLSPKAQQGAAEPDAPDMRAIEPYLAGLALLRRSADLSVLNEAARRFEVAVAAAPTFAPAFAGLCEAVLGRYRRTRDPADLRAAENACTRALALNSKLMETEKALGALYISSGRFDDAEPVYRRILVRDPRSVDGFIGLARADEGRQELAAAEQNYRRAVAAEPSYWLTHNALGGFLYQRGRLDEAIAEYRLVAELTPSSASAYNNFGAALLAKLDFEGAIGAYRKSLALEPSRSAYSNLATGLYYRGRFVDAVENYSRATQLAPQDQTLWGNLADALWQIPGRRADAIVNYEKAISLAERDLLLSPGDAALRAQLGYYYGRVDDAARSKALLQGAASAGAQSAYVQYFTAVSAADRGDMEAARIAAREAARLGYPKAMLDIDPALAKMRRAAKG